MTGTKRERKESRISRKGDDSKDMEDYENNKGMWRGVANRKTEVAF